MNQINQAKLNDHRNIIGQLLKNLPGFKESKFIFLVFIRQFKFIPNNIHLITLGIFSTLENTLYKLLVNYLLFLQIIHRHIKFNLLFCFSYYVHDGFLENDDTNL